MGSEDQAPQVTQRTALAAIQLGPIPKPSSSHPPASPPPPTVPHDVEETSRMCCPWLSHTSRASTVERNHEAIASVNRSGGTELPTPHLLFLP